MTQPSFRAGDKVRVKREDARVRWRKPHLRTPGYLFGAAGVVDRFLGCFPNPEREAFIEDKPGGLQPLYLVTFQQKDLWSSSTSSHEDVEVTAEIYEAWIRKADDQSDEMLRRNTNQRNDVSASEEMGRPIGNEISHQW